MSKITDRKAKPIGFCESKMGEANRKTKSSVNEVNSFKPANAFAPRGEGRANQGFDTQATQPKSELLKLTNAKPQSVQHISLKQLRAKSQALRPDSTSDSHALVEDAQKQLNDAEQKATAIIEEAEKQAEILKNEAIKEGFIQGEEAGKIKVQEESNSLVNFFQNAIEEVSSLKSSILKEMEPEIVQLSLMLAEKLVLNSFQIHPEAIASIIQNLIKMVDDEEEIKILVNPTVPPILEEYQPQFLDIIKSNSTLKIEGDEKISEGGCLIVTNTKILDAQIETRLLEATKTLLF